MKILCIGDSLTSCWNIDKQYAWTTILAEKTGAQVKVNAGGGRITLLMSCGLKRDGFGTDKPDLLFLMGGTNDILVDEPLSKITANLRDIMDYAKEHGVQLWLGLQPLTTRTSIEAGWQSSFDWEAHNRAIEQLRQWLADEAAVRQVPVLDFQEILLKASDGNIDALLEDGLHPNKEGYRILGEKAVEIVRQKFRKTRG